MLSFNLMERWSGPRTRNRGHITIVVLFMSVGTCKGFIMWHLPLPVLVHLTEVDIPGGATSAISQYRKTDQGYSILTMVLICWWRTGILNLAHIGLLCGWTWTAWKFAIAMWTIEETILTAIVGITSPLLILMDLTYQAQISISTTAIYGIRTIALQYNGMRTWKIVSAPRTYSSSGSMRVEWALPLAALRLARSIHVYGMSPSEIAPCTKQSKDYT